MTPRNLLARLTDRFALLTNGGRTRPPRQQTLRALIDWSFELLDEAERATLRRCAVFASSFDLDGAEAVIHGGAIRKGDVLDLVASLLDKSFIARLDVQDREPRYRLMESMRHYALGKLEAAGETAMLHHAHGQRMVAVFGHGRRRWPDTDVNLWRADYEPEVENLFAALAWAFGEGGHPGVAVALTARLRPFVTHALITAPVFRGLIRAAMPLLGEDIPAEDAAWMWYFACDNDWRTPRRRWRAR